MKSSEQRQPLDGGKNEREKEKDREEVFKKLLLESPEIRESYLLSFIHHAKTEAGAAGSNIDGLKRGVLDKSYDNEIITELADKALKYNQMVRDRIDGLGVFFQVLFSEKWRTAVRQLEEMGKGSEKEALASVLLAFGAARGKWAQEGIDRVIIDGEVVWIPNQKNIDQKLFEQAPHQILSNPENIKRGELMEYNNALLYAYSFGLKVVAGKNKVEVRFE